MRGKSKIALLLSAGILAGSTYAATSYGPTSWNPKKAADYLDRRAGWWISWPGSARDHGTFCISCHTAVPYALARPALRIALGEKNPAENERKILDDVTMRVRLWKEEKPFYDDQAGAGKSRQSRGTESVLNALILANTDARIGRFSDAAQIAFENMWATQDTSGAWPWLDFGNAPFEARDSQFYGACLAAIAIGTVPEEFRAKPDIQRHLMLLRGYLNRQYDAQSLINQAVVLWASAKLPGILTPAQQSDLVQTLLKKQRADGGWNTSSLAWTWKGSSFREMVKLWVRSEDGFFANKSDAYATGLITFALEQTGVSRDNPNLQAALGWLAHNQNQTDGRWRGSSLNHRSDPTPTGLFMSDAATAYSVLALTQSNSR